MSQFTKEEIMFAIRSHFLLSLDDLRDKSRNKSKPELRYARALATEYLIDKCGLKFKQIDEYLGTDTGTRTADKYALNRIRNTDPHRVLFDQDKILKLINL